MCFETPYPGAAVVVVPSYTVVTGLSPVGRMEKFVYFASLPYRNSYCSRSVEVTSSITNRM